MKSALTSIPVGLLRPIWQIYDLKTRLQKSSGMKVDYNVTHFACMRMSWSLIIGWPVLLQFLNFFPWLAIRSCTYCYSYNSSAMMQALVIMHYAQCQTENGWKGWQKKIQFANISHCRHVLLNFGSSELDFSLLYNIFDKYYKETSNQN